MKLLYCTVCDDVFKLDYITRECKCGGCNGRYKKDGLTAVISGSGIPIGFANSSFSLALRNRPQSGLGQRFDAFVIPVECLTIIQE